MEIKDTVSSPLESFSFNVILSSSSSVNSLRNGRLVAPDSSFKPSVSSPTLTSLLVPTPSPVVVILGVPVSVSNVSLLTGVVWLEPPRHFSVAASVSTDIAGSRRTS